MTKKGKPAESEELSLKKQTLKDLPTTGEDAKGGRKPDPTKKPTVFSAIAPALCI